MARCINTDEALQIIDSYAKTVTQEGKVVVDAVRDIVAIITPTADVVPKSEVDKWFRECEELQGRLIELKKEVAREIFEETSKASIDWGCYCITTSKAGFLTSDVNRTLAELKKKYTEDGK